MKDIDSLIKIRYAEAAKICDDNLSCGKNLQFAGLKTGEVILDLGCGRGQETIAAANLVGSRGKAVGLDLTEKMVVAATESACKKSINNVEFVVGKIESLPFKDENFDVVISN